MKQINDERLRNVINEVFKNYLNESSSLITERWSYSDEMDAALDLVYDKILEYNKGGNSEYHKIDYGVGLYKGICKDLSIFGIGGITLVFYMYECLDDKTCEYIIRNGYSENNYDEVDKVLSVTVYTVLGNLIENISNKNVSHELEHILQVSKGRQNCINYRSLTGGAYELASDVIREIGNNNKDFDSVIAWLIYYSNPHEQDAFMNEYYQDLSTMSQFINDKNSETHIRYNDYSNKIDIFKRNIDNSELIKSVGYYKRYGYNIRNMGLMIDKGLKRFGKKMRNIEKHFTNTVKMANESHFRLKPVTNGTLIRLF